jgi:hypothetical protein
MKYAVMGPGMSGETDDLDEAQLWLRNNPGATLYHAGAPIATDLRALTRDIHFWDFNNPRFGLTSEQAAEVIRCIEVVVARLDAATTS